MRERKLRNLIERTKTKITNDVKMNPEKFLVAELVGLFVGALAMITYLPMIGLVTVLFSVLLLLLTLPHVQ